MATLQDLAGYSGQGNATTLSRLLADRRMRTPSHVGSLGELLSVYHPSLRERIANTAADFGGWLGAGRYAQQDIARKLGEVIDFIPGLGEILGADDTASSFDSGDYRGAAINLGATAIGVVPIVGDWAAKAIKKTPYHRFTRGPSPEAGAGHMMFASGEPERVSHYGSYHWAADPADFPNGTVADASDAEFVRGLAKALRDNSDEVEMRGYGAYSPESLAAEAAPTNIVDSAGFWDSDLVGTAWREYLEPNGILGVKTPDGFIVFDPSYVRRAGAGEG